MDGLKPSTFHTNTTLFTLCHQCHPSLLLPPRNVLQTHIRRNNSARSCPWYSHWLIISASKSPRNPPFIVSYARIASTAVLNTSKTSRRPRQSRAKSRRGLELSFRNRDGGVRPASMVPCRCFLLDEINYLHPMQEILATNSCPVMPVDTSIQT